jgi:hypothetical protein
LDMQLHPGIRLVAEGPPRTLLWLLSFVGLDGYS